MNEGSSMTPAYLSHFLNNTIIKELSFFSINHSKKLTLINQFIRTKLAKYQSKLIGPTEYDNIYGQPRIDYIDKLKSYYQSKYRKFNISLDNLRLFIIKRKEFKREYQMLKNTSKGIVLSLFLGVNGLFSFRRIELIKTTPQLFVNFFLLTSTMAITSNFLIQKKINKKYKKKISSLEKNNLQPIII